MSSCTGTIPRPLLLFRTPTGMPAENSGLLFSIPIRAGTGTASEAFAGAGSPVTHHPCIQQAYKACPADRQQAVCDPRGYTHNSC